MITIKKLNSGLMETTKKSFNSNKIDTSVIDKMRSKHPEIWDRLCEAILGNKCGRSMIFIPHPYDSSIERTIVLYEDTQIFNLGMWRIEIRDEYKNGDCQIIHKFSTVIGVNYCNPCEYGFMHSVRKSFMNDMNKDWTVDNGTTDILKDICQISDEEVMN